jgi:hypothetical protein
MMERSLGSCVAVSREATVVAAVAAVEGRAVVDAEEEAVGALETVEMECSISAVRARPGGGVSWDAAEEKGQRAWRKLNIHSRSGACFLILRTNSGTVLQLPSTRAASRAWM